MALRFLALGDSYTAGEGIDPELAWPARLAGRLRAAGLPLEPPEIVARTGWTTAELLDAIEVQRVAGPFDLVTLLAGVNDQYRGLALDAFAGSYRRLLELATRLAGSESSRVLALSIPDWGVTPFAAAQDRLAIAAAIDEFNRVARAEADRLAVRWADLTALSRRAADDPSLVAPDGLHPSANAHEAWVDALLPAVERTLALR